MPLSFPSIFILILALLAIAPVESQAQTELKPDDVFVQAFMLLRKVRSLEATWDYSGAAAKCQEASEMYDSISKKWPRWKPEMLEARRLKVRQDFKRLQQRAAEESSVSNRLDLPQPSEPGPGFRLGTTRPGAIPSKPRPATPRQKFEMLEREVERLKADRARLLRQGQEQQDNSTAANRALGKMREDVGRLQALLFLAKEKLGQLEGSGVVALKAQVDTLKEQLDLATDRLKEQNQSTGSVIAEYEKGQQTIAKLSQDVEEITQQRDEMAAIIKGLQTGESSGQLIMENMRLREALNVAQARVADLELNKLESETEIAGLREEVSLLRMELATVKQENEALKERLLDFRGSLDETEQELNFNPPSIENETARQENELLRQVIARQLKKQTLRQQGRDLFIAELQDLEAGSDELIAKLDAIVADSPLSPEEQAAIDRKPPRVDSEAAQVSSGAPTVGDELLDRKIARSAEAAAYNFGQGRYESAEAHYNDILQFVPQHVETLCNLGATKMRLNQVKEARNLFERAILSEEKSGRAQLMLGVSCFFLEDMETAITSIKRAMEIEPNNAEPPSFLGVFQMSRGDDAAAVEALQMAVDLKPRDPIIQFNLALALLRQTPPDPRRAQNHYQEALNHGLTPNPQMEDTLKSYENRAAPQPAPVPASLKS